MVLYVQHFIRLNFPNLPSLIKFFLIFIFKLNFIKIMLWKKKNQQKSPDVKHVKKV